MTKYVYLHNDLIRNVCYTGSAAGQSPTIVEYRLLYYAIANIKDNSSLLSPQTFSLYDFLRACGIDTSKSQGWGYSLKRVLHRLQDRVVWLNCGGSYKSVKWLDQVVCEPGMSIVSLTFHKDMIPYLSREDDNYTSFPLDNALRMISKYAITLYPLLVSCFSEAPKQEFTIAELRERLDCSSGGYDSFSNFRRRVLEPAILDIKLCCKLPINYTLIKNGRHYERVRFALTPRKAG